MYFKPLIIHFLGIYLWKSCKLVNYTTQSIVPSWHRLRPFDHWINQSPNVVIVSIYYRLNIFGFLAHPALADSKLGSLNAGFLDQREALRWVKSYIHAFGGDPESLTINGQSAGASSVELHLVANGGNSPLFKAAIVQSLFRTTLPTPEQQMVRKTFRVQRIFWDTVPCYSYVGFNSFTAAVWVSSPKH